MWIVYKLTFKESDKYYIGVTNNLSRRIYNHKCDSIRNNKTKKEKWIKSHLDKQHKLYSDVLYTFDESSLAYSKEYEILSQLITDTNCMNGTTGGIGGISSIRDKTMIAKFKHSMSKNYVFIKDGKVLPVRNASEFARQNGYTGSSFQSVAKGRFYALHGYRVFYLRDWLRFTIEARQLVVDNSFNLGKSNQYSKRVIWKDNTEPRYYKW